MHTLTATIPNYLAQSTGQVTITTFISALVALFFVFTIIGALRHPSGPGLINLIVLVSAIYLGWAAARWPGVEYDRGLLVGLLNMAVGSIKIVTAAFLDLIGASGLAEAIRDSLPT
jgi:hypothetical protein